MGHLSISWLFSIWQEQQRSLLPPMIAGIEPPAPFVLPRVPIRVQVKQELRHCGKIGTRRVRPIDTAHDLRDHDILFSNR